MRKSRLNLPGTFSKATTDEAGQPHLLVTVSGPELDKQGERMSDGALDTIVAKAQGGGLYLTPSHDVPLPLGKSVGASKDEAGHVTIDFLLKSANPFATQLHEEVEKGEWSERQVSIGGPRCVRKTVWDAKLSKNVVELSDIEANHVALTFPEKAAYPHASLDAAVFKAFKDGDKDALQKAGFSDEEISKAYDEKGNWIPATFASRWASEKLADELPEMLDTLRWTIECILWMDDAAQKRALLDKSFGEFTVAVLGEIGEAAKAVLDAIPDPALGEIAKTLTEIKRAMEAFSKTISVPPQPTIPTPPPTPEPPPAPAPMVKAVPDTQPEDAPDVHAAPTQASLRKSREDRLGGLRKAFESEPDPIRKNNLREEINALSVALVRSPSQE